MDPLEPFLAALRPLLREHGAKAAYIVGSRARGTADAHSDVDVVIVAPTARPATERFRDYLPAILACPVSVDLLVYTPEEFERMCAEGRPFLTHALEGAKLVSMDSLGEFRSRRSASGRRARRSRRRRSSWHWRGRGEQTGVGERV